MSVKNSKWIAQSELALEALKDDRKIIQKMIQPHYIHNYNLLNSSIIILDDKWLNFTSNYWRIEMA